jgi:hypothetical protein
MTTNDEPVASELVADLQTSKDDTLRLTEQNVLEWEDALDDLGHREGFKDKLSECVDNLAEFKGLTPREALQQGWYDYPD